jgi:hypothetical protein
MWKICLHHVYLPQVGKRYCRTIKEQLVFVVTEDLNDNRALSKKKDNHVFLSHSAHDFSESLQCQPCLGPAS